MRQFKIWVMGLTGVPFGNRIFLIMSLSMSLSPIAQKAHDIAYATFRVAGLIRKTDLRAEIEKAGIALIAHYEEVADPLLPFTTPNVIEKLERLVAFAESIGEMKPVNASVLKRELKNLQTAIDFHINTFKGSPLAKNGQASGNQQDIDISSMFPSGNTQGVSSRVPEKTPFDRSEEIPSNSEISVRQTAILRNIRENQFCRLRNIVDAMPNISERTIRNDIQTLIERGLVRRVGGGGPNSYFETMELTLRDNARV